MTPEQLTWFGNLLTNQGVAVVALLLIFAFIGFMFWPWFTKQYEAGQLRFEKQGQAFADSTREFTATIQKRDEMRYGEHTQYLQMISQINADFLKALAEQRSSFTHALNELRLSHEQQLARRDDATSNIVNVIDDLVEQVAEMRRGNGKQIGKS